MRFVSISWKVGRKHVPYGDWQQLSAEEGAKGPRLYDKPLTTHRFIVIFVIFFITTAIVTSLLGLAAGPPPAEPEQAQEGTSLVDTSWDVVVLGWIDACWVCQFEPSPHVRYTQVLAGKAPSGQAKGRVNLVAVAEKLLPEGRTPIYKSQQEEICLLKKVVVPGYEGTDVYEVVDVMEATPENLAAVRGQ